MNMTTEGIVHREKKVLSDQVSDATVKQKKNEDKAVMSKSMFRHNFSDIFHLSRIFEDVLETLFFSWVVFQKNFFSGKNV